MITNAELAKGLETIAEFLEAQGDNPYRVRAFRKAARIITTWPHVIAEMVSAQQDLTVIPGIGSKIGSLIIEAILKNDLAIFNRMGQERTAPLEIVKGEIVAMRPRTYRLHHVIPIVESMVSQLKTLPDVINAIGVGEYRRYCELMSEIRILVATSNIPALLHYLQHLNYVKTLFQTLHDEVIIKFNSGMVVYLELVNENDYANKLLYSTGSRNHINQLKRIAAKKSFTLNASGMAKRKKKLLIKSEEDIYSQLGLDYIPPELREDHGEIQAATQHRLPKLITLNDLRGNLHTHTLETDGIETLENMVKEGIKYGYEYIAITDHSQSLKITNGLDEKRLWKQIRLIDKLNNRIKNIVILKSIEVDILEDGRLDLPDSMLKELDIRVCAVHSKFRLPKEQQTNRILKAMDNRYFNILAHPTGRLIKKRQPYEVDMEKIIHAAKERNCFLEMNCQPYRLDLNSQYAREAKEAGVKMSIATDAHSRVGFSYMVFGIFQARRAWLEPEDVINTLPVKKLLKMLQR